MCGIVGILGREAVAGRMVEALRRLEYRGYDSAGIATLEAGRLERCRAEGRIVNLELKLVRAPLVGAIGIGHTRWATHGRPNEINAHPHATERLAVVHNGIVENFREIRAALEADGVVFETETDTEAVARAVTHAMERGLGPVAAVEHTLRRLRGAFALAFLFQGEENLLVGARHGAPLAVGFGEGEAYLGSDALALAPLADTVSYLDEGDLAVLSRRGVEVRGAPPRVHAGRSCVTTSSSTRARTATSWPRRSTNSPRWWGEPWRITSILPQGAPVCRCRCPSTSPR